LGNPDSKHASETAQVRPIECAASGGGSLELKRKAEAEPEAEQEGEQGVERAFATEVDRTRATQSIKDCDLAK
jgi:hypothetical protein